MHQHQKFGPPAPILPSGSMCKSIKKKLRVLHRVDDTVTRKADSNVSNIIIRYRSHLGHLPLKSIGLDFVEGAVISYWRLFVQQQQQHYSRRACTFVCLCYKAK